MVSMTAPALELVHALLAEEPDSFLRIVFTPACGGAQLSLQVDTIRFSSDTAVIVDGVSLYYTKHISHLIEDIHIDVMETEDGPEFSILNGPPSC